MNSNIKILILEDALTDLELVKIELERENISFTYKHVITEKEFVEALAEFKPDIILSDYTLPQFDGLSALKITKEMSPNTPFIVVTGSINEETAVKCINSGADDYIVKGHYQRLGAAIRSAIEKSEIRIRQQIMQKELGESEERFRSIFEQAAVGIIYADLEGNFLQVNKRLCEILRIEPDDASKYKLSDVIHPEDLEHDLEMLKKIVRGEVDNLRADRRCIRGDGTSSWVNLSASLLRDPSGEPLYFIGIIYDISARIVAENALKQSEMRFRSIVESANDGIIIANSKGKIIQWNNGVQKIFGYTKDEILNKPVTVLMPDKFRSGHNGFISNFLKDRKGAMMGGTNELEGLRKDGTIFPIELSLSYWETDSELFFSGIIRDISDRKEAERTLIAAKEKAERSDKLKTEFLAQMSHEIRTPINVILNFVDLIKEDIENKNFDDVEDSFSHIHIGGNRIIRTIDLILNMAEIQTGSFEPNICKFDLYSDIMMVLEKEFKYAAGQNDLEINFNKIAENTIVMGDQYSVHQIFSNLLDNAVKYTPKGKIEISVNRNSHDKLVVEVSDTGIGISSEFFPDLFEPFVQEEHGYTRKFEGNGLGLALVKKYCDINNLSINVESEKGKGSKFSVTFNTPVDN